MITQVSARKIVYDKYNYPVIQNVVQWTPLKNIMDRDGRDK